MQQSPSNWEAAERTESSRCPGGKAQPKAEGKKVAGAGKQKRLSRGNSRVLERARWCDKKNNGLDRYALRLEVQ